MRIDCIKGVLRVWSTAVLLILRDRTVDWLEMRPSATKVGLCLRKPGRRHGEVEVRSKGKAVP